MITKSKIFTFLAALFLICLVFSHASPTPKPGDVATVSLEKLDGKIIFTQVNEVNVTVKGKINKGIKKNALNEYFVLVAIPKVSFPQFGIKKIEANGTAQWEMVTRGHVNQLIDLDLSILQEDKVLDTGTIIIPF